MPATDPFPADAPALVRRFLAAYNDWNIAGMLDCLAEDVAFDRTGDERVIGREAVKWAFAKAGEGERQSAGDIEIMVNSAGNRAAAEYTLRGTGPGGASYSVQAGLFAEIEDGRISRLSMLTDPSAIDRQSREE